MISTCRCKRFQTRSRSCTCRRSVVTPARHHVTSLSDVLGRSAHQISSAMDGRGDVNVDRVTDLPGGDAHDLYARFVGGTATAAAAPAMLSDTNSASERAVSRTASPSLLPATSRLASLLLHSPSASALHARAVSPVALQHTQPFLATADSLAGIITSPPALSGLVGSQLPHRLPSPTAYDNVTTGVAEPAGLAAFDSSTGLFEPARELQTDAACKLIHASYLRGTRVRT